VAPNPSVASPEQNESAIQITLNNFQKEQVSLKSSITQMGLETDIEFESKGHEILITAGK
jgi:hypothetical protein